MQKIQKGLKQLYSFCKKNSRQFPSNGLNWKQEMLGIEYNEGMKVIANFIPSEDLETGNRL